MTIQEIASKLVSNHSAFTDYIDSLSDKDFMFNRNEKWTAGQQLDHLIRAVKPLTQGFMLPSWVFGLLFGKSNRPGKTYEELVEKYKLKLAAGGRASGQFIPPPISLSQKSDLIIKLNKLAGKLALQVSRLSEQDMDTYVLPHPLLGKLTLREMMYFTIYHVKHHEENIKAELEKWR
ncbi:MAG TPA: DinB family protein [Chitinophagaceae bacterium]|nr:DinB family protein [Chitinophagaceae bacterium]